jgi:protein SCO1
MMKLLLPLWISLWLWSPAIAANNSLTDEQLLQIKFVQRLNSQVSPALVFLDSTGGRVRIGDYFGKRPLVLILGYYRCPMLCTLVMDGVTESLRDLRWTAGRDFDVIFVSIDPSEKPGIAAAKKRLYVRDYGRDGSENGWHFLTSIASSQPAAESPRHDQNIAALADEIGFRYAYDPGLKEYAHPSGFVVLTPGGRVTHYFFGVQFSSKELDAALHDAGAGKVDSPVAEFILLCCEYNPLRGKYGHLVMDGVRVSGVGMLAALGLYFFPPRRKSQRPA